MYRLLMSICEYYNIPAYLHPLDHELLQLIRRRPSVYKKKMYTNCESLVTGKLQLGPFEVIVHHTPGHSAGSVCLEIEGHLFTGDTVFKQNVGKIQIIIKSNPSLILITSLKYILSFI